MIARRSTFCHHDTAPKPVWVRITAAAIVSYLAFGLMTAVTEQVLSSLATSGSTVRPSYFVTQCLYLIGAGYLCSLRDAGLRSLKIDPLLNGLQHDPPLPRLI
jgi:hypothetical protein